MENSHTTSIHEITKARNGKTLEPTQRILHRSRLPLSILRLPPLPTVKKIRSIHRGRSAKTLLYVGHIHYARSFGKTGKVHTSRCAPNGLLSQFSGGYHLGLSFSLGSSTLRDSMTAHDRTAYWVQKHSGEVVFYSPSFPPSELDDYISVPPSPAESSRSIPPRMILRYDDGRPDIPIPHADHRYSRHNARTYDTVDPRAHYDARVRGRQHGSSHGKPPARRAPERVLLDTPEDIRVLPAAIPHVQPRSRSVPRSYDPAVGPVPQQIHPLPPSGSYAPISHAYQPQPQPSSRHSRRESHAYYQPSNGYHHPPPAPNSVIFSHSAPPVLMGHPTAALHTGAQEYRRGMSGARMGIERSTSSRTRSVSLSGRRPVSKPVVVDRSDSSSASDSEPDATYYARRSRGKTPISTPSTSKSVTTATSSGRSPVTPLSAMHGKRPFFQRLFHFAGKLSHAGASRASSVADVGDLHRRHSISESRR
ncbi:hypothetical protein APHAL10511_000933 [Amanita phalloides]|nr:hypothetical protein APHAL10511_000933 [Amanita phalloides]